MQHANVELETVSTGPGFTPRTQESVEPVGDSQAIWLHNEVVLHGTCFTRETQHKDFHNFGLMNNLDLTGHK